MTTRNGSRLLLAQGLAAGALGLVCAGAVAVPVETVGVRDSLLTMATLGNSGSGTEEAWIEGFLGFDADYLQLSDAESEGETAGNWDAVTGTGSLAGDYALDFGAGVAPLYYLIKVGNSKGKGKGNGTEYSHYLYDNENSLQWAYLNLGDFGDEVSLTNIGVISHAGRTGTVQVPEPGTLSLLGAGLLAIGFAGRRRRAAARRGT